MVGPRIVQDSLYALVCVAADTNRFTEASRNAAKTILARMADYPNLKPIFSDIVARGTREESSLVASLVKFPEPKTSDGALSDTARSLNVRNVNFNSEEFLAHRMRRPSGDQFWPEYDPFDDI